MKKNIADDTWYEIFLHLPLNAIFRFKTVNKVWFSTLSCPNFISKWYKLNYVLLPWVLVQHAPPKDHSKFRRKFTIAYPDSHSQFIENHQNGFSLSFLDPIFPNGKDQRRTRLFLIGSSNGLVLCTPELYDQNTYYVCNPLTKKWVLIPPPKKYHWVVTGFICNDKCFSSSLVSTSYTVIRIPRFASAVREFEVEIFSSELGEWNVYDVSSAEDVTWVISSYDNFVTHNGVFYWFQKRSSKILAVSIGGNTNRGTCSHDCRLINIPDRAMDGDLSLRHLIWESEGLICYAMVNEKEKSLSVWVLEEDWCLLYKDTKLHDMLEEMNTSLIGAVGTDDLIKELKILGFNPIEKNVVILGYNEYIWAYNTRTKGCEQLFHPSFLRTNGSGRLSFLTFALKLWPTVLPPVSW